MVEGCATIGFSRILGRSGRPHHAARVAGLQRRNTEAKRAFEVTVVVSCSSGRECRYGSRCRFAGSSCKDMHPGGSWARICVQTAINRVCKSAFVSIQLLAGVRHGESLVCTVKPNSRWRREGDPQWLDIRTKRADHA
jgi:hypothetical protein